jgi:hypothetical protein
MRLLLYGLELPYLRLDEVKEYIEKITNIEIDIKDEFFKTKNVINYSIARRLASIRIVNPKSKEFIKPKEDDIIEELNILSSASINDILYDGFEFQLITNELLDYKELSIVLSTRFLCTFDNRYHLRSIIFGYPSIISIPGIVEAPAKPKEYYLMVYKYRLENREDQIDNLKEVFSNKIIDYDYRINEVIKGLLLQVIKYHLTGDPFCNNNRCKLYNAHWQEELINSQLNGYICNNDLLLFR